MAVNRTLPPLAIALVLAVAVGTAAIPAVFKAVGWAVVGVGLAVALWAASRRRGPAS